MRFTVIILLLPALAACANDLQSMAKQADAQAIHNNDDDNECRSTGTTVGTDPYFQCRANQAQTRLEAETAAREAKRNAAALPPAQPQ
jgi:hypothetical protein